MFIRSSLISSILCIVTTVFICTSHGLQLNFICTLQDLQLCCTGITSVNEDAFQGLDDLGFLSLHSNNLTVGPSLQHIRHIKSLHLYDNMITNFSLDYFSGCDKSNRLFLQRNNLVSLPDMTHVAHGLQIVALDANRLVNLHPFEGMPWPQLWSFSVSDNLIKHSKLAYWKTQRHWNWLTFRTMIYIHYQIWNNSKRFKIHRMYSQYW